MSEIKYNTALYNDYEIYVAEMKKAGVVVEYTQGWEIPMFKYPSFLEHKIKPIIDMFNSEDVLVKATINNSIHFDAQPAKLLGKVIATATSRDSGATVNNEEEVFLFDGPLPRSGGSNTNWTTVLEEGSSFIFMLPVNFVVHIQDIQKNLTIEEARPYDLGYQELFDVTYELFKE